MPINILLPISILPGEYLILPLALKYTHSLCLSHYFVSPVSHPRAVLLYSLSQWLLCDDLFRTILETLHTQNKIGSFTQTKHLLLFLLTLILSV